MPLEAATYISDLVTTNPVHATDDVSAGDDHIRLIKSTLKNTFTALTGAVTASHTELNVLDGITASTAELNILDGVTLNASQINDAARLSANNTFSGTASFGSTLGVTGDVTLTAGLSVGGNLTLTGTINGVATSDFARKSQSNVFTGTGGGASAALVVKSNDPHITLYDDNGTSGQRSAYMRLASDRFLIYSSNDDNTAANIFFDATLGANGAVPSKLQLRATELSLVGTVSTPNSSASEVGYKGAPPSGKTADHTIVAEDAGHVLRLTSAADDITVQASGAPPDGSVVGILNKTGGSIDILQGSGMTLTLAGTSLTGNRTLAANGMAFVYFDSSSTATVGGSGVA